MKLEISQAASESVSQSEIGFSCGFRAMPISDSDRDTDSDSDRFGKVVISGNSH